MDFVGIHLPKESYKTGDTKSKKEAPAKYPVPVVKPERVSLVIGPGKNFRMAVAVEIPHRHAVLVREPENLAMIAAEPTKMLLLYNPLSCTPSWSRTSTASLTVAMPKPALIIVSTRSGLLK
jgi:hypothetical protein